MWHMLQSSCYVWIHQSYDMILPTDPHPQGWVAQTVDKTLDEYRNKIEVTVIAVSGDQQDGQTHYTALHVCTRRRTA
jgi:hypothetical protein